MGELAKYPTTMPVGYMDMEWRTFEEVQAVKKNDTPMYYRGPVPDAVLVY